MRLQFFSFLLISSIFLSGFRNGELDNAIKFDGLYIARTGLIKAANIEIYTYLKFYDDSTVYLQSVSSKDAEAVSKWFGRSKKFSQSGTYTIKGDQIHLDLSNKDSKDKELEGSQRTTFTGKIASETKMCMLRNSEKEEFCFEFVAVEE